MKVLRLLILSAAVLPALWNCRREEAPAPAREMGIYIEAPGDGLSRADVGEVPSTDEAENLLHDMKIWVFTSDGHEKIAALNIAQSQLPVAGRTRR